MASNWNKVPKAEIVEFANKCGEACPTLREIKLIKGPDVFKKGGVWVARESPLSMI
jgi:hypothetical protein